MTTVYTKSFSQNTFTVCNSYNINSGQYFMSVFLPSYGNYLLTLTILSQNSSNTSQENMYTFNIYIYLNSTSTNVTNITDFVSLATGNTYGSVLNSASFTPVLALNGITSFALNISCSQTIISNYTTYIKIFQQ